jgi:hypothetical protein
MSDDASPCTDETALMRDHGAAWEIVFDSELGVWNAERRDRAGGIRFVVGHDAAELAAKLAALAAEQPGGSDGGWISGSMA